MKEPAQSDLRLAHSILPSSDGLAATKWAASERHACALGNVNLRSGLPACHSYLRDSGNTISLESILCQLTDWLIQGLRNVFPEIEKRKQKQEWEGIVIVLCFCSDKVILIFAFKTPPGTGSGLHTASRPLRLHEQHLFNLTAELSTGAFPS